MKNNSSKIVLVVIAVILLSVNIAAGFNQPPLAEIQGAREILACGYLILDGSKSFDPDGNITSWQWRVERESDGKVWNVTGKKLVIEPPLSNTSGYYKVTLIVTDNGGADAKTASKTVGFNIAPNGAPQIEVIEIIDDQDNDGIFFETERFGLRVRLREGSNDDSLIWNWEYKDKIFYFSNSSIPNPSVLVVSAPTVYETYYTLKAVARDTCGQKSEKEINVAVRKKVADSPPRAKITDPSSVRESQSFVVDGSESKTGAGYDEKGDELTYEWKWTKFGKNQTLGYAYGEYTTLTFPDGGVAFTVYLTVKDKSGQTDSTNTTIFVEETEDDRPVADASATLRTAALGENFTLNGNRSSDDRTYRDGNLSYVWKLYANFGGVAWEDEVYTRKSEYTYKFQRVGVYSVMLTVRDSSFQEGSSGTSVNVVSSLPKPTPTPATTPTVAKKVVRVSTPAKKETVEFPEIPKGIEENSGGILIIISIVIFLYLISRK